MSSTSKVIRTGAHPQAFEDCYPQGGEQRTAHGAPLHQGALPCVDPSCELLFAVEVLYAFDVTEPRTYIGGDGAFSNLEIF